MDGGAQAPSKVPPIFRGHVEQLDRLLRGHDPILVIPEPDDDWIRSLLECLMEKHSEVRALDAAGRLERLTFVERVRHHPDTALFPLPDFLGDAETQRRVQIRGGSAGRSVVWIRDVIEALRDPVALGRLKALATRCVRERDDTFRVLVTGEGAIVPSGVAHLAHLEALERPTPTAGLSAFIRSVAEYVGVLELEETTVAQIAERVQGLEASTIRRIILRAAGELRAPRDAARRIDGDALLNAVHRERNRSLSVGALEVRDVKANVEMGGLDVLSAHLQDLKALFDDLRSDTSTAVKRVLPKGMLLVGLPGCGKSLAAEVAARTLKLPLLQLHAGRLMDRWLGSSEEKLETALATAQAAAPCVLWIDEIEKAIGGLSGSEGGGTGSRMLGRLLGWMQDNRHGVYVIATANSLDAIPPELLRRGRFDDHFKLGRPKPWERLKILEVKCKEYQSKVSSEDLRWLRDQTDEFSGADIDALVREATKVALLSRRAGGAGRQDFERVLSTFSSQAKDFGSAIVELEKKLSTYKFRDASSETGDARSASADRPAPSKPLHRVLGTLLESTDRRLVRWPLPLVEGTLMFEFTTEGGARMAKFGPGGQSGVPPEAVLATYAISREHDYIRLDRAPNSRASSPDHAILQMEGDTLYVRLAAKDRLEAKSLRATFQHPLPPELWSFLGAREAELQLELRDVPGLCNSRVNVEFHGTGRGRRATLSADGKASAEYKVRTHDAMVILDPEVVFGDTPLHTALQNFSITIEWDGSQIVHAKPPYSGPVSPRPSQALTAPDTRNRTGISNKWACTFTVPGAVYNLEFEPTNHGGAKLRIQNRGRIAIFTSSVQMSANEFFLASFSSNTKSHIPPPFSIGFTNSKKFNIQGSGSAKLNVRVDFTDRNSYYKAEDILFHRIFS